MWIWVCALPLVLMLLIAFVGRQVRGADSEAVMMDVAFASDHDGTTQYYVVRRPASFPAGAPHDVLIALHGRGSDRWQFMKDPRDECRAARDVAATHGMIYVSPDYRAKRSWMGPAAEADVVQIIREVKQRYRVARVFICGGSMGGSGSLTFAVLHPELIAGVAAMNGTANFLLFERYQEDIEASFGGSKAAIPLEYMKRSAEYWPEKLTMPLALTASGRDKAVPPESVQRLAKVLEAMNRKVLLIHREAAGHVTNYEDGVAILDFVIQNAGPRQ